MYGYIYDFRLSYRNDYLDLYNIFLISKEVIIHLYYLVSATLYYIH